MWSKHCDAAAADSQSTSAVWQPSGRLHYIADKQHAASSSHINRPPIWSQLHLLHDILQADKIAHIKADGVLELLCCRVCTSEGCQWAAYKGLAAPCHQPDQ